MSALAHGDRCGLQRRRASWRWPLLLLPSNASWPATACANRSPQECQQLRSHVVHSDRTELGSPRARLAAESSGRDTQRTVSDESNGRIARGRGRSMRRSKRSWSIPCPETRSQLSINRCGRSSASLRPRGARPARGCCRDGWCRNSSEGRAEDHRWVRSPQRPRHSRSTARGVSAARNASDRPRCSLMSTNAPSRSPDSSASRIRSCSARISSGSSSSSGCSHMRR